jgi:hypothetical protein
MPQRYILKANFEFCGLETGHLETTVCHSLHVIENIILHCATMKIPRLIFSVVPWRFRGQGGHREA